MVVKTLKKIEADSEIVNRIIDEAKTHANVSNHPHIVQMIGVCSELPGIVIEHAKYGSMEKLLIEENKFAGRDHWPFVLQASFCFFVFCIFVFLFVF